MKRSFLTVLAVGLLVIMTITGCVRKSGDISTKATSTEAVSSGTKTAEKKLIEITVGSSVGWDTLCPFRSNVANDAKEWMTIVYESLGYIDGENKLAGWVAKDWNSTDNGVTYDISIYDYVYDSAGNHITSSDIVWFVNMAKEKALKPNFKYVESVEALDDYTVKVTFNNTLVGVFETFMTDAFAVSQKAYEEQGDDFVNSCISTSPYKVTSFISGATAVFEKRDDYWQKEELLPEQLHANADKVTLQTISEASQLGIALETGVIDFAADFAPSTAVQFEDNPDYVLQAGQSRVAWQIYFSGADEKAVANDKYLRQAICYAIDNELLINAILEGYGEEMHDAASTYAMGYQDEWYGEEYYPYDTEKAKECLLKSNYNGEELVLLCNSTRKNVAEIIQGCCAAVGIKIKLNVADMALLTVIRLDGTQYDMFINQVGGITLANYWNTRFDARSYKTGDATSRKDYVLADLIAEASTLEGFTSLNINKVHNYIKDEAYGYGMYQPQYLSVWRSNIRITKVVNDCIDTIIPSACEFN